ncbi:MAG: cysteine desulfurase [Nannocystaceae bacterium]|nr:cysteine desulfurase [Nannocystaceae bacterium]
MRYPPALVINLDHNATTPLHPSVRDALVEVLQRPELGNPSSTHGLGRSCREVVEAARRTLAAALDAVPLGVTFVSGGTEADNLALLGGSASLEIAGKPHGVATSRIEHPAVVATAEALAARGTPVVWLPVSADGSVSAESVERVVKEHPEIGLVSVAAANHELGNIQPIEAIVAAVRRTRDGVLVHTDAVQAFGKTPVRFTQWGVDLLSVSSHKIYGPTGIGALIHHTHLKLDPRSYGGSQERGRRVGTENWIAAHGFGVAASLVEEGLAQIEALAVHRDALAAVVTSAGGRVHGLPMLANTLNFGFENAPGELMCMNLDLAGIAASTGSACSAGSLEPSKVLLGLGLPPDRAAEAVRVSMGRFTTAAEVAAFEDMLPTLVERVRKAHRGVSS